MNHVYMLKKKNKKKNHRKSNFIFKNMFNVDLNYNK